MRRILIAALIAAPLGALAHADHHEDTIKERRAYFTLYGANIGPLAKMAKGEVDYDADKAMLHAKNFAAIAAYDPTPHFASGTSNVDVPGKTRALPAIWEKPEAFGEKIVAFTNAVEALQGLAGGGRADLGKGVQQLGATCKGCHDDFRAKDF